MKRFIPLILASMFFCISLAIKQELMLRGAHMSENDKVLNSCMQLVTLSPITIIGGSIMLIAPFSFLGWIDSLFGRKATHISIIQNFFLRSFGIVILLITFYSVSQECAKFIN